MEVSEETLKEIIKRIDENVAEIKDQTQKTNGRVKSLELWRAKFVGAIIVMNAIFIPAIIILFKKFIN